MNTLDRQVKKEMAKQILRAHPNTGSAHATPASTRIDLHYMRLRMLDRWTWERYKTLANMLRLTPYELASVVCLPHSKVAIWRAKTIMPVNANQGAYAIALVLTIMEHHALGQLTNDTIKNPFPDLNLGD